MDRSSHPRTAPRHSTPSCARLRILGLALAVLIPWCFGNGICAAQSAGDEVYDTDLENAVRLYSEKQLSEATRILQRLTTTSPDRKEAYLWLGKTHQQLKEWPAARAAFETYTRLAPNDPDGPRQLGKTYVEEGNFELAIYWYKKAVDLAPDNEDIQWELERAQRQQNGGEPPESAPEAEAKERVGFWRQGVGGLLGARKATWTRIVAILIYGLMSLIGTVQTAAMNANLYGDTAGAATFFSGIIGGSFFYILFWGIPIGIGWAVMGGWIFILAVLGAGIASQA